MTSRPVLVTGVTGATGGHAVKALQALQVPVRALVRKDDERAAGLRAQGVQVVIGDLLDFDSVRRAMTGVRAAYLVFPLQFGLIDASAYFAQAALECGVSALVNMSQISALEAAASHQARDHWVAERVLDRSGVPVTHLRPTFFAEWLLYPWVRTSLIKEGVIRLPFGHGRHAPIAAADQARVIAAILADPALHAGRRYTLQGPVELDHDGIAAAVGAALGRTIVYEPITIEAFRKVLEGMGMREQMVQHICAVALDYQNGIFAGTDDAVERVTGTPPMTVEAFIAMNRAKFEESPA